MPKVGVAPQRRAQIIDATFFSIAVKGYSAITMQDIANSAGLSKGVIHYYFKNKEELFISVLEKLIHELDEFTTLKLAEVTTPVARMQSMIAAVFEKCVENKKFHTVVMDFWAHASKHPTLQKHSASQAGRYRHLIAKIIMDGIASGDFRADVDADLAAAALLGQMQGLLTQWTLNVHAFDLMEATAICQQMMLGFLSPVPAATH